MGQAIDKTQWAIYCERISDALEATDAEVEAESLKLGAQGETEWLPLIGISYDPEDDIIDIALEGVDHIIEHPQTLQVDGVPGVLRALAITDTAGNRHLMRLRDALTLPRPH
jgi:Family of unknown function (DUF5335)